MIFLRLSTTAMLFMLVSACGFHLRGTESIALPAELSHMRVTMTDRAAFPPLLVEMRNALRSQAGVTLAAGEQPAALLALFNESFQTETLGRDSANAPLNYVLNYKVSFSLKDASGRDLIAHQTVRTQREYSFRKENVLATEKEGDYLRAEMQRDAVQQILRRLAALNSRI